MDVRELKNKATELFSKGKFAKAAETYEQYCKADPKDLQARLRMGDAWAKSGKKDKAIIAYHAAAEGFAKDGFLPRAIAASKLVLELDPSHKGVSQMLADLYARKSGASRPSTARTIGAKPDPAPAAKQAVEPSPTNRADAIEITVEDEPPAKAIARPPEAPSPSTRSDAIEVPIEVDSVDLPKPPPEPLDAGAGIEIELGSQPVTGEIEVPIAAGVELDPPPAAMLPKPGELPPELDLPPPPPPPATYELDVPPEPGGFALDPAPKPPAEPIIDLEQVVEPAPVVARKPPAEPILDLEQVVEPAPVVAPPVAPLPAAVVEPPPPPPAAVAPPPPPAAAAAPPPPPAAAAAPPPPPPAAPEPPPEDIVVLTKKRDPAPPFSSSPSRSEGSPPGLKPRQRSGTEPATTPPSPPMQSPPSGARIWLPPTFQAPPAAGEASPPPPAQPITAPSVSAQTELERSLEVFAQFDVDNPPPAAPKVEAPPPAPAPRPAAAASFTELELEGDTLLQAVEAAATLGVPQSSPSVQLTEEAMEAPDELKPDPGALPKIPLFSDLPSDAFIALFERCPLRRAEPGDRIIEQGSQGTSFFVICAGKVRVLRTDGEATRELATLEEGAFFGEMALLSDAPRSASVEAAAEDTQLLEIPAIVLTDLSAQYPTVSTALKKFCRQRMLANLMNSAALFKPFTKSERRDLVQRFRARDAVAGEVLIKEGQPSDGLYVVLMGEVAVLVNGRQIATLKEGQVFGEMSLLTRSPTSATVKTLRRTSFLRLPREDFDQLIMSHPQILEQVAELTDERRKQNAALQARPDASASMV